MPSVSFRCWLVMLMAAALAVCGCPGDTPDNAPRSTGDGSQTNGSETLSIATGEWEPWFSRSRPDGGPVLRVVTEAFRLEGIDVHYEYRPWTRAYDETRRGLHDGLATWGLTMERAELFHASDEIFEITFVFYHRADQPFEWETLDDLKGMRIGATREYTYGEHFYIADRMHKLTVEWMGTDEDNYRKLMGGRIDAFPQDRLVGHYQLRQLYGDEASAITSHPRPLNRVPNHLLIPRSHPDGARLIAAFNRGLARLRDDGRLTTWLSDAAVTTGHE